MQTMYKPKDQLPHKYGTISFNYKSYISRREYIYIKRIKGRSGFSNYVIAL